MSSAWEGLTPPYSTIVVDPPWPYEDRPLGYQRGQGQPKFLNDYSTMTVDQIGLFPVGGLAAPGAHLYLWTTQRFLWDAKSIAERWGFPVLQVLTWCKEPMGLGGGGAFANTTEFVLFGRQKVGGVLRRWREFHNLTRAEVHEAVRGGKPTGIVYRWEEDACFPTEADWARLVDVLDLPGALHSLAASPERTDSTWWRWARGEHSEKPAAFLDLVERVSPGPYVELFARAPRLGWDSWGLGYETVRSA